MRIFKSMLAILAVAAFAALSPSASAVPPGKTLEFNGGPMGTVHFSGKVHHDAGLKCSDCHTKIFKFKKGADKITMAAINKGQYCGVCHNGGRAFKASDPKNCKNCHKK